MTVFHGEGTTRILWDFSCGVWLALSSAISDSRLAMSRFDGGAPIVFRRSVGGCGRGTGDGGAVRGGG